MERVEGHHPLLDRGIDLRIVQFVDIEIEVGVVLVVGMARSGIAAARLLQSRGYSVFVTDAGQPASTAELEKENANANETATATYVGRPSADS